MITIANNFSEIIIRLLIYENTDNFNLKKPVSTILVTPTLFYQRFKKGGSVVKSIVLFTERLQVWFGCKNKYLGCGFDPNQSAYGSQLIDVCLPYHCFSLSLPSSFPPSFPPFLSLSKYQ